MTPQTVPPVTEFHQQITGWMIQRRNSGATPDQISDDLVRQGWDVDSAAQTALRSLRNADRHRVLYSALCWGVGITALAVGSTLHLAVADTTSPLELAFFITLALVAAPIAIGAGIAAQKVEQTEPHAIWSPSRRVLFGALATSAAVVGIIRLLHYTFNLVAALVGARGFEMSAGSLVQVLITLSIAGPLFWWSFTEWRRSNVARRRLTNSRPGA